jgi:DNA-binding MarR family transcriptional regulator
MARIRWLDDRQQHLWRSYIRINQELFGLLGSLVQSESGLSAADYGVLVTLSEAPDGLIRARDLGAELGWDRSRVSHQLARMGTRGMVTREECAEDARGLMVRITPEGRRAIEAAAPAHAEAVQRHFFDHLSRGEVDTLTDVFDRILDELAATKAERQ